MFDNLRQDITGARSRPDQEPGLCRRLPHHAGARHRRHLSHLQRRQGRADHAAAVCAARTHGADLHALDGVREDVDRRSGGDRLPQHGEDHDRIAAWSSGQQNLTGDGEPVRIGVGFVTANLFDVLGSRPLLGRVITAEEDVPNGAAGRRARLSAVAIALRRRPRRDRQQTLMINDVPVEVIGVMPEGFRLPTDFTDDAAEPTQLWRPMRVGHDAAQSQPRLLRRRHAGARTDRGHARPTSCARSARGSPSRARIRGR